MNPLAGEDPYHELSVLRRDMLRFAELQLRDTAAAEDAVQDAMVAAMTRISSFEGRAQISTWLFAILKNKIIDMLRARSRFVPLEIDIDEIPEDTFDGLFDDKGYWPKHERPAAWGDPEDALSRRQFWVVFQACLDRLPVNTARVFMMREFLGLGVDEVVAELGISKTNCGVILHRARMMLRVCLQTRWFDTKEPSC
ncbi:MAG: sigma-70 family RNA polymerase sigma factor [Burkholderiales bacterium]|nr:sigma-70 family RNA polymerase sigma factor [Burkholderiales bacterium]